MTTMPKTQVASSNIEMHAEAGLVYVTNYFIACFEMGSIDPALRRKVLEFVPFFRCVPPTKNLSISPILHAISTSVPKPLAWMAEAEHPDLSLPMHQPARFFA